MRYRSEMRPVRDWAVLAMVGFVLLVRDGIAAPPANTWADASNQGM
jgi:hypothetical protein